jgi:hypothetical protein
LNESAELNPFDSFNPRLILLYPMKHDLLLRAPAETSTPATATAATIAPRRSTCRWFGAGRSACSCTTAASTPAPVSQHTASQSKRVVIRHFQVPSHPAGLCDPGDHFSGNRAVFDIQNRRVADFGDRPADLSGCIGCQIHDDRLAATPAAATSRARFRRRSVFLRLEGSRNVIGLPLPSQAGLAEQCNSGRQHDGWYK